MRKHLVQTLLTLFALVFTGCSDQPVNWTPTFDSAHSIPYGTSILRKEMPELFPDSKIKDIKETIESFDWYSYPHDHYIYIDAVDRNSEEGWQEILYHVHNGGSAFISSGENIPELEKTLGVQIVKFPKLKENLPIEVKNKKYNLTKGFEGAYFNSFDEDYSEVLGHTTIDGKKHPNFIKFYYGEGYLLLHTEPYVFTNYYMLKTDVSNYVVDAFSYLDSQDILWDNHRLHYRSSSEKDDGGFFSALAFILKNKGLKEAFYLLLVLGILYLLFNSRRRQAAIPILFPYSNYSLNFAKTLSNLYRHNADHTAMVRYKTNYFLEQIRVNYNITSKDTEKDFEEILSIKSGVDLKTCRQLVVTLFLFKSRTYFDKEDFIKLQAQIETFTNKAKNYGRK